MVGLERHVVKLELYDPRWQDDYEKERIQLLKMLGDNICSLAHIGSTAIPGIHAKPIIDVVIGVRSIEMVPELVELLKSLNYVYRGENGLPKRHFFRKTFGNVVTHHLHVVEEGSDYQRKHLFFRDHLRQNKEAAQEYDRLKIFLAKKFDCEREKYVEGKGEFIRGILLSYCVK